MRYTSNLLGLCLILNHGGPIGVYIDPLDQPPIGTEAPYGLAPAATTTLLPNGTLVVDYHILSLQGYFVTQALIIRPYRGTVWLPPVTADKVLVRINVNGVPVAKAWAEKGDPWGSCTVVPEELVAVLEA
ncbi:hypothetical protein [Pyrodictium delaneyi]|nr:hypothetical protein [Pyrodictium delaneyi]OWJ55453.1 hypothetical protein Pdsh_01235 [Pyrodictium delaneyi]